MAPRVGHAVHPSSPPSRQVVLSIVIPAFNCAEWLARSVGSAFLFADAAVEVVVVDDGSTDATRQVLAGLQQTHPTLRVLTQANAGLSAARNAGIAQATGTHIVLLDADDELAPMRQMPALLDDVDMLRFGIEELTIDGKVFHHVESTAVQTGTDYLAAAFKCGQLYAPSWSFIYRRGFLVEQGLRFAPGLLHEDMLFTVEALMAAQRFKAVPDIGYRYFRRPGSITDPADPARLRRRLQSLRSIERIVTAHANRQPQVDLGWWSLHVLDYAQLLARGSGSRTARWLVFTMWCGFFLRYRQWGPYRTLQGERYRLRRSLAAVLR